ncbi:zinc-binding dehydrogenase [Microbacterium sp. ZW T5_45]|uniref:zinc-binding dehydrogenase n=1 Tax=Microbacterium sp. ZW T5_45 TaxID=3378080 RepID=UPI0038542706
MSVEAFAPNPGDLAALAGAVSGSIPGWDGSGVVLNPAADGHGPRAGERVMFIGLEAQGWAQRRAVPHALTAVAADDMSSERLATLPVAATSALRATRRLGSVLGRRVLIVGAGGAVGRFAVQFAARSGAHVVAIARNATQHGELRRLGAAETHTALGSVTARVHGAIDLVGGEHLVRAYALLESGATAIALGHSAESDEHFPYGAFVADTMTSNRSITSFFLGSEPDLAADMSLIATDPTLDVGALDIRPWTALPAWFDEGAQRSTGRVVFRVAGAHDRFHDPLEFGRRAGQPTTPVAPTSARTSGSNS